MNETEMALCDALADLILVAETAWHEDDKELLQKMIENGRDALRATQWRQMKLGLRSFAACSVAAHEAIETPARVLASPGASLRA